MADAQRTGRTLRLILVRHADAGEASDWIGPDDERPLSVKGIKQASRLAALLLDSKLRIDAIRTSPARRCAETASIIAVALDVDAGIDERLATGPQLSAIESLFGNRTRTLLIVGHEPQLSRLLEETTGISTVSIEKGAAVRIDLVDGATLGGGRLVWLAPPSLLRTPKRDR